MDHSAHKPLAAGELTEANLVDAVIYGPDDEKVGTVSHMHGGGEVIVDVGGFLGIGAKPVALPVSRLNFMRDEDGDIHATTMLTKDDAESAPRAPSLTATFFLLSRARPHRGGLFHGQRKRSARRWSADAGLSGVASTVGAGFAVRSGFATGSGRVARPTRWRKRTVSPATSSGAPSAMPRRTSSSQPRSSRQSRRGRTATRAACRPDGRCRCGRGEVGADMRVDRAQAVVPGMPAAGLDPHLARREVELVVQHGDISRLELEEARSRPATASPDRFM